MSQHRSSPHTRSRSSSSAASTGSRSSSSAAHDTAVEENQRIAHRREFAQKRYDTLFERFTQLKATAPRPPFLAEWANLNKAWLNLKEAVVAAAEGFIHRGDEMTYLAEHANVAEREFKVFKVEYLIEAYMHQIPWYKSELTASDIEIGKMDALFFRLGNSFLARLNRKHVRRMRLPGDSKCWPAFERCAEWRIKGMKNRSEKGIQQFSLDLDEFEDYCKEALDDPEPELHASNREPAGPSGPPARKFIRKILLEDVPDGQTRVEWEQEMYALHDQLRRNLPEIEHSHHSAPGTPQPPQHSLVKIRLSARHRQRYNFKE